MLERVRELLGRRIQARLRQGLLHAERHFSDYAVASRHGGHYVISTDDRGLGRALHVSGRPEFLVLERALDLLHAHDEAGGGELIVDVGANIGTTVIPALIKHGFARGLAFEPDPDNVRLLRANAALNSVHERLEIVEAAVSAEEGTALLARGYRNGEGRLGGTGTLVPRLHPGREVISVETVTIDQELGRRGIGAADLGLLWIDAQGFEGHILRAADSVTTSARPVVLALRRGKLHKAGGLDDLVDCVGQRYAWVADLRPTERETPWRPKLTPAHEMRSILDRRATTDVLAFGAA